MKIDTKYKRGFTAEEIALIAVGLDKFNSSIPIDRLPTLRITTSIYPDPEEDILLINKIEQAIFIRDALLDEISIAYRCLAEPAEKGLTAVIELFEQKFSLVDDCKEQLPIPEKTTITKISVIKWLRKHGQFDKADLLESNGIYLRSEAFDDDSFDLLSSSIKRKELVKVTDIVGEECLLNLPDNMLKPTKTQLENYIKGMGVVDAKGIAAIVTLIMPEGHKFSGGHVKREGKDEWRPKSERVLKKVSFAQH